MREREKVRTSHDKPVSVCLSCCSTSGPIVGF